MNIGEVLNDRLFRMNRPNLEDSLQPNGGLDAYLVGGKKCRCIGVGHNQVFVTSEIVSLIE